MEYRVEELSAAVGVGVDTVRFYQTRGLLPKPDRRGRIAIYSETHLARLRRVRALVDQGFTLAQIRRVIDQADSVATPTEPLLAALMAESVGARSLSRAELAAEAGVPEALIRAAESARLIEPLEVDGEARFSEADLEMGRAALAILGAGFPLHALLELAVRHASHVRDVADDAIDLFDEYVRQNGDNPEPAITEAFRELMPQVTRLVALHFQRTLVGRALERLAAAGESERGHFERALADTAQRLEVEWR
jgi:DNA-binding transcriptional MerR regulator